MTSRAAMLALTLALWSWPIGLASAQPRFVETKGGFIWSLTFGIGGQLKTFTMTPEGRDVPFDVHGVKCTQGPVLPMPTDNGTPAETATVRCFAVGADDSVVRFETAVSCRATDRDEHTAFLFITPIVGSKEQSKERVTIALHCAPKAVFAANRQ